MSQTVFVWDGARLAQEITNPGEVGGGLVRSWEYEPGTFTPITQRTQPVSGQTGEAPGGDWSKERVDQQFQVIVSDLVGTPTELVSPDGREVLWSNKPRTIWGAEFRIEPGAVLDCPIRFAGQYEDTETGLFYNLNRYYDPTTNRYTTADPLGLTPAPDAYNYVRNPTGWLDPLGLTPCNQTQVPFGETDLGRAAQDRRIADRNRTTTNYAAGQGESGRVYTGRSDATIHAEGDVIRQADGDPIQRIYSERQPCNTRPNNCEVATADMEVEYSLPWSTDPAVRAQSNQALQDYARGLIPPR